MARLTYQDADGWGLHGVSWDQLAALPPRVYGALVRLRDLETLERLQQYRQAGGLGCLEMVASRCGGDLTADKLRGVLTGTEKLPIEQWRLIRRALDQLEEGADE